MSREDGDGLSALVVDDEHGIAVVLSLLLERAGFEVASAGDLDAARALRARRAFDLLLLDTKLPDGSGLDLARASIEAHEDCEIIVMTASPSAEWALALVRLGVADYLVKPFDSMAAVQARVARAIERLRRRRRTARLVTELQAKNARLEDLVVRDGLTGLYNHAYFQERLEAEVARSERNGHQLSLLFIDLDHFKDVNDGVGHQVGDAILRRIADMLSGAGPEPRERFSLREHDLAARYGGDELVLLLPETAKTGAAITAERLRRHIASAGLGNPGRPVTISIGLATYPADGRDRESLLRAADTALYAAKRLGRNRVIGYYEGLAAETELRARVSRECAAALEPSLRARAFALALQPIVSADSRRPIGFEALCRPQDPALGSARDAVAAAEQAGKMVQLGRVLRELAAGAAQALHDGELLFVNVHPHELADPRLTERGSGLHAWASRVVLELPESAAIREPETTSRVVGDLHALGFRVALDQLGSGYAGLHALARVDADFVKLDRSLVVGLHRDARTARLVKHILEYAGSEGISVVAEGVETQADFDLVRAMGCPLVQGYFTGAPSVPSERTAGAPATARKATQGVDAAAARP